jgi:MoxR-like ATPase
MRAFVPDVCPVQSKFATCRREQSEAFIKREQEIDLVLTALVAREHVLLAGPPGCA